MQHKKVLRPLTNVKTIFVYVTFKFDQLILERKNQANQ